MVTRTLIPSEDDSKTSLDADYYVVMISSLSLCLREVGAPKHTVFWGAPKWESRHPSEAPSHSKLVMKVRGGETMKMMVS